MNISVNRKEDEIEMMKMPKSVLSVTKRIRYFLTRYISPEKKKEISKGKFSFDGVKLLLSNHWTVATLIWKVINNVAM